MGGLFTPDQAPIQAAGAAPTPPPPPPLPPAAIPPSMATDAVKSAGSNQVARAKAQAGQTTATSSQGDLTPVPTAKASLLGETA